MIMLVLSKRIYLYSTYPIIEGVIINMVIVILRIHNGRSGLPVINKQIGKGMLEARPVFQDPNTAPTNIPNIIGNISPNLK